MNSDSDESSMREYHDSDTESQDNARGVKFQWTTKKTLRLIHLLENHCKILWDTHHMYHRDRAKRTERVEFLATKLGTTTDEIGRKLHNLRSQFKDVIRRIRKKKASGVEDDAAINISWLYFEPLTFLLPSTNAADSFSTANESGGNTALEEYQVVEEEIDFGLVQVKVEPPEADPLPSVSSVVPQRPDSPAEKVKPVSWSQDPINIDSASTSDDCQIFGDFVALELRSLRSDDSRRKLKRIIQKAILEVGEEDYNCPTLKRPRPH